MGKILEISTSTPAQLNIQYEDGRGLRSLEARVDRSQLGGKTLRIVSLERDSREGLSPLEVAKICRAGVDFLREEDSRRWEAALEKLGMLSLVTEGSVTRGPEGVQLLLEEFFDLVEAIPTEETLLAQIPLAKLRSYLEQSVFWTSGRHAEAFLCYNDPGGSQVAVPRGTPDFETPYVERALDTMSFLERRSCIELMLEVIACHES